jgi:hypothetical protein
MIDTLTSRDRFCAIAFDDRVDMLPGSALVDATDRNRFRAVEALAKVEARGGTEIAQPLRLALGALLGGTADRERVIMLVTDGQVGNEDHILRELAPALRNIKMYTLGIDQAVNAAFLRRLAAAGGGLCELVESEDRLDAVMAKVHRRIGTPIATELALRATGLEIERATVAPAKLPDVYAGAPVVVFGRYRGAAPSGAAIDVTGTTLGDPFQMTVSPAGAAKPSSWLAASWARAHIRDLEDQYASGARPELEQQIVRVSKQFSVLSRFTAFLAVDHTQVVNKGGVLHQVVQPVEKPAGWTMPMGAPPEKLAARVPTAGRAAAMRMSPGLVGYGGSTPDPASFSDDLDPQRVSGGPSYNPSAPAPHECATEMLRAPRTMGPAPAGGAPSQPPAPSSAAGPPPMPPPPSRFARKREGESGLDAMAAIGAVPGVGNDAYLAQLATLARGLEGEATGRVDIAAIRRLRQRLVQWIEDVRSVGSNDDLATAIEALVERLSAALATPATLADEAKAIAGELTRLAAGGPPPPPTKKSRLAFWK